MAQPSNLNSFILRVMLMKAEAFKNPDGSPDTTRFSVEASQQMDDGTGRPCRFTLEPGKGNICTPDKFIPFSWFDVGGKVQARQGVKDSFKGGEHRRYVGSDWGLHVTSFQPFKA